MCLHFLIPFFYGWDWFEEGINIKLADTGQWWDEEEKTEAVQMMAVGTQCGTLYHLSIPCQFPANQASQGWNEGNQMTVNSYSWAILNISPIIFAFSWTQQTGTYCRSQKPDHNRIIMQSMETLLSKLLKNKMSDWKFCCYKMQYFRDFYKLSWC